MPDILDCGDGTRLKPLQASNRKPADGSYDIGCAVPYGFQRLWHRHSSMSVILVRHLAGKKIHGTTTYHSSRSHMRGVPWGCIGTALRYACSVIPDCGAFHIGTFAANMAACFVYAALSAWLGGTRRIVGRAKEYVNRGCGMGMCGGLSTMSTLALEEFTMLHDGKSHGLCGVLLHDLHRGLSAGIRWRACRAAVYRCRA